jgi:hypothetical protein
MRFISGSDYHGTSYKNGMLVEVVNIESLGLIQVAPVYFEGHNTYQVGVDLQYWPHFFHRRQTIWDILLKRQEL